MPVLQRRIITMVNYNIHVVDEWASFTLKKCPLNTQCLHVRLTMPTIMYCLYHKLVRSISIKQRSFCMTDNANYSVPYNVYQILHPWKISVWLIMDTTLRLIMHIIWSTQHSTPYNAHLCDRVTMSHIHTCTIPCDLRNAYNYEFQLNNFKLEYTAMQVHDNVHLLY